MNLEKLFEKALRAYFAAHRVSRDGLEDAVADAYADWSDKPLDELDGKTPREYVAAVTDPAEIAEGALAGVRNGGEPSPLFADRVAEVPAASARLTEVLESDEPERVRVAAAELLHRAGAVPVETYIDLVFDPDTPDNLRETLIEQLEYTDGAAGPLLARLGEAEGENRKILAELLLRRARRKSVRPARRAGARTGKRGVRVPAHCQIRRRTRAAPACRAVRKVRLRRLHRTAQRRGDAGRRRSAPFRLVGRRDV